MAELVRYRGQVTSKSADSNLQPVISRTIFVTKRGATTSAGGTGTVIPLEAGGLRYATTDKVMVEGDESTYRSVGSVDSDTQITLGGGNITYSAGDRIVNLGKDTGGASPNYDGYRSAGVGEFIYTDPVDSGTAATENKVTSDSTDGEYGFWILDGTVCDIHVMTSDDDLSSGSQTIPDIQIGSGLREYGYKVYDIDNGQYAFTQTGLQAAIDAAETAGGGLVRIGQGTISCSTPLTVGSNTTIEGRGWQTVLKSTSGADAMTAMFENKDLAGSGNSNIIIRDLKIDMDDTTLDYVTTSGSTFRGRGIRFEKVTDVRIENVWCHDCSNAGIFFNDSCKRIWIVGNLVEQVGKAATAMTTMGIYVQHTQATSSWVNCNEIHIKDNTVREVVGQTSPCGIRVYYASKVDVSNNIVDNIDDDGGTSVVRGIQVSGQDVVISDNLVEDVTASGGLGTDKPTGISGGGGATDGQPHGYTVTGNKVRNAVMPMIFQNIKDAVISNNLLVGTGVAATSANGIEISANTSVGATPEVVYGDLNNIVIGNNTIADVGGNGISLSAFLAETSITGNAITNTGNGNGMSIQAGQQITVFGNTVTDAGTGANNTYVGIAVQRTASPVDAQTAENIFIIGNLITSSHANSPKYGIRIGDSDTDLEDEIVVAYNVVTDTATQDIYLDLSGSTFTDGDTTPSVAGAELFKTGNTGNTAITTFDNGYPGQRITIIIGDSNTDFTDGATLIMNGGVNWTASVANDTIQFVYDGTAWYETTRSVN
jgi:hypothetical protein